MIVQHKLHLVLIFVVIFNECINGNNQKNVIVRSKRVVNGSYSNYQNWTWLISIKNEPLRLYLEKNLPDYMNWSKVGNDSHICGATLISEFWIVSARHCVEYDGKIFRENWKAGLGSYNLLHDNENQQIIDIDGILFYDKNTDSGDIVLMHLSKPAKFTKHIRPINIENKKLDIKNLQCIGMGWGSTVSLAENALSPTPKNYEVQYVNIEDENCLYRITDLRAICFSPITGVGCRGDSGGPLVCRNNKNEQWKLVGITSSGTGCTKMSDKIIFANVSHYYEFISNHMNETIFKNSSIRYQFTMISFVILFKQLVLLLFFL